VEGDAAWGHASTRLNFLQGIVIPPGTGDFSRFTQKWDAGLRGRVGYLVTPTVLVYGTGGVQWQDVSATVNCAPATCATPFIQRNGDTLTGWSIGGGVETMIWGNWLLRGEYRYADFGSWTTTFGPPAFAITKQYDVTTHTAFGGLAYKF
jgi:outer membrane immunogenic protein